jgi:hypothetical protein
MEFVIAHETFRIDRGEVEARVVGVLPDPVQEHYVVISGRRFPPKQVIAEVTGLDRADFTTHQARRVLRRLGFTAARVRPALESERPIGDGPHGGRQAAALEPYIGKWVALDTPTNVLVAADTPQEVLAWLSRHRKRASFGMFRVPASEADAQGVAPL